LFSLVRISTSDTDALVAISVDFVIVCPTSFVGSSPEINSVIKTSLRINLAVDGLIKKLSKSITRASSP